MNAPRSTGWWLLAGAGLLLVPYLILTVTFDYPAILRQEPGVILTRFAAGGPTLIVTWLAFGLVGLPLVPAVGQLGQWLESRDPAVRWATSLGIAGLVVQMVGLLRWAFVVPVLARLYIETDSEALRVSCRVAFIVVHQYGGVVLGEHLGQLFTIVWTVVLARALGRVGALGWGGVALGYGASAVYLLAQAELLATVIPGFPVWWPAGLLGSTGWLVWLMVVGWRLLRSRGRRPPGVGAAVA